MLNTNQPSTISDYRRKRINKLKKMILITGLVLIFLSLILCVVLLVKVSNMQKTIDELLVMRDENAIVQLKDESGRTYYMYTSAIEAMVAEKSKNMEESETKDVSASVDSNEEPSSNEESSLNEDESKVVENETTTESLTEDITEPSQQEDTGKYVYLTFDDGPSIQTEKILKILDEYNVTATFFVVGLDDEESLKRYKMIVDSGNSIGLHSYSHDYNKIYASVDAFAKDVQQVSDIVYEATGVRSKLYRFPGGSSNTRIKNLSFFVEYLNENGYTYYDWNSSSRDASVVLPSKEEIVSTVVEEVEGRDNVVVLMHDSEKKVSTVEALPQLIEKLKAMGYTIRGIDERSVPVQHR